jgi:YfiH family protein
MHFLNVGGRRYAQFERLRTAPGLAHAFSTRPLDVSMCDDSRAAECAARRRQMAIDFGFDPGDLHCCVQVHEARVAVVGQTHGVGRLEGHDAVVTDTPGGALMAFSADCPLVLVYDPVCHAVGVAHASWRGTVAAIARKLVETMRRRFGCQPTDLLAGVGPSAGPECYEVRQDVYEAAAGLPNRDRLFTTRDGRLYFDLWEANRSQLQQAGIGPESIETAGICTMSRRDLFYSYRREGAGCGHFGLLAGLC